MRIRDVFMPALFWRFGLQSTLPDIHRGGLFPSQFSVAFYIERRLLCPPTFASSGKSIDPVGQSTGPVHKVT